MLFINKQTLIQSFSLCDEYLGGSGCETNSWLLVSMLLFYVNSNDQNQKQHAAWQVVTVLGVIVTTMWTAKQIFMIEKVSFDAHSKRSCVCNLSAGLIHMTEAKAAAATAPTLTPTIHSTRQQNSRKVNLWKFHLLLQYPIHFRRNVERRTTELCMCLCRTSDVFGCFIFLVVVLCV